jgi:hypothetical protein
MLRTSCAVLVSHGRARVRRFGASGSSDFANADHFKQVQDSFIEHVDPEETFPSGEMWYVLGPRHSSFILYSSPLTARGRLPPIGICSRRCLVRDTPRMTNVSLCSGWLVRWTSTR